MRGRKPKTAAQRQIEGNPGKRALTHDEPAHPLPAQTFGDAPPPELDGDLVAQQYWQKNVPKLLTVRQVRHIDEGALVALCKCWSRWVNATQRVDSQGLILLVGPNRHPIQNPYLGIANTALRDMKALWSEIGMTPTSRTRVRSEAPPADPESEADQFRRMFLVKGAPK